MDANKLKKLRDEGYTISKCCGACKHGSFAGSYLFGCCSIKSYNHLKHTESKRPLSIIQYGSCNSFEMKGDILSMLKDQKWGEFLED